MSLPTWACKYFENFTCTDRVVNSNLSTTIAPSCHGMANSLELSRTVPGYRGVEWPDLWLPSHIRGERDREREVEKEEEKKCGRHWKWPPMAAHSRERAIHKKKSRLKTNS